METTKNITDFDKVLEKLRKQNSQLKKDSNRKLENFDFHSMFTELEETLKKYKSEHSKKNTESEIRLSELTLTA